MRSPALIITCINILGGLAIGVVRHGMAFADAAATYTTLTVGDGLVSQIPALLVSTAAGIVVTKGGMEGTADVAWCASWAAAPSRWRWPPAAAAVLAVLPGLPVLPFLALAGLAGGGGVVALQASACGTGQHRASARRPCRTADQPRRCAST